MADNTQTNCHLVGLPEENLSNSLAVSRHLLRWLCFLLQASISPR